MFQRTVISSPAPAVTYSQLVAGIFAFAKISKSARQIGSAPDAASRATASAPDPHSRATASDSVSAPPAAWALGAPVEACAFDLVSSAISVAQQDTRSAAAAPADTNLCGVLTSVKESRGVDSCFCSGCLSGERRGLSSEQFVCYSAPH